MPASSGEITLSPRLYGAVMRRCDDNAGGARCNNRYIQFLGIGTLTDSLAALHEEIITRTEHGTR